MRSSEVAIRAGVNVQTLRYYERRGILPEPRRSESGYRSYDARAVETVRFVKRTQRLGFSLDEIERLLALADDGRTGCDATQALARRKIAELDAEIAALVARRDSLRRRLAPCSEAPGPSECPLFEARSSGSAGDGEGPDA